MKFTIRDRRQKVANCIKNNANQSVRTIASAIGLSKSSVHRHQQAISRGNQYPESEWWETTVGYTWLIRLVIGVVYHFGLKQGVGAESLSEFFKAIQIETHVAISPSALRNLKQRLRENIIAYESAQSEHCQASVNQGICVGADETFFGLPVLVLIELSSGFIFTEVSCENRTYATWVKEIQTWWEEAQWQCHFLVSDSARALIKLAVSGLDSVSVADLFHAMRSLGQPIGRAMGRQHSQLKKQLDKLEYQLSQATSNPKRQDLQTQIETTRQTQQQLKQEQQTYHAALETISLTVHPFTFDTLESQLLSELSARLATPLKSLTHLTQSYGGEQAQKAISTFETQIPSLAQGIHAWWQWVIHALESETQDIELQNWLLKALFPWVYWSQQVEKTRHPQRKQRYQQAASDAFDQLLDQTMTLQLGDVELQRWVHWCEWICAKYQRTSSAVEGRNGYLARLHHAGRGFSQDSLKVLTIIHNFDLKRSDGSTAAQRLFNHAFPDLFESILDNITELPQPRRTSKAHQPQTLTQSDCPALS